jgi:hypothetical protein
MMKDRGGNPRVRGYPSMFTLLVILSALVVFVFADSYDQGA